MSLTQKILLFCLLFVSGTGAVAVHVATEQAEAQIEAHLRRSHEARAAQIVDLLGKALLQDNLRLEHAAARKATLSTLSRVLARSPDHVRIYSVNCLEDGTVLSHEVCREAEPRAFGAIVPLSAAGHRAIRTATVQTEFAERADGTLRAQTYAPIGEPGSSRGLLVTETDIDPAQLTVQSGWISTTLCLAAGLLALLISLATFVRPLERIQEQLIAKQNLEPSKVRTPNDMLREVTRIIDSASSDRDYYEARLKQQDRIKESSIRRKDEAISNTVHELRTPLTSIIASLEIMLENEELMTAAEKTEFMNQASTAARHMMFVVNDMLDAAAIEAGQIHMNLEPCSLSSMLNDARRSMEIIATARAMNLHVADVDPEIQVLADSSRLMQVIFNLVSNAVKYTPSGTTITMRTWPSMKSVIIEVEDEGEPIPEEKRDHLFKKFSKFQHEPDVDSTGIGLYLSKKLVELMSGTIGYRAGEDGRGSVFWFTLPLVRTGSRVSAAVPSSKGRIQSDSGSSRALLGEFT